MAAPVRDPGSDTNVCVERALGKSVGEVWPALTDPLQVARWRGVLSGPLVAGELRTLDLGDGDSSALEVLVVSPPTRLEYVARSMGIGPARKVTWQLTSLPDGCLLSVSDHSSQRTSEEALAVRRDWLEVTSRLAAVLNDGGAHAAEGPADLEITTELPGDTSRLWASLIEPGALPIPLDAQPAPGSCSLRLEDGVEPLVCTVPAVSVEPEHCAVTLRVAHDTWPRPTTCRLRLRARRQGVLLSVSHVGWEAIGIEAAYQRRQRRRFAAFWTRWVMRFTLRHVRAQEIPTLLPEELHARMGEGNWKVFDSNRVTVWDRGHVPGAVHVGQEEIPVEVLPQDKQTPLVFYCRDQL